MVNPFRPKSVQTPALAAAPAGTTPTPPTPQNAPPAKAPAVLKASPAPPAGARATVVPAAAKPTPAPPARPTAATEQARAKAVVESVLLELPELLGVAVIDLDSGVAVAHHRHSPAFAVERAAPHYATMAKRKRLAIAALQLPGEQLEEIVITLRQQLHLLRIIKNTDWMLYLAVSQRDTNMSVAREVLRAHAG